MYTTLHRCDIVKYLRSCIFSSRLFFRFPLISARLSFRYLEFQMFSCEAGRTKHGGKPSLFVVSENRNRGRSTALHGYHFRYLLKAEVFEVLSIFKRLSRKTVMRISKRSLITSTKHATEYYTQIATSTQR